MKQIAYLLLITAVLTLLTASTAFAEENVATGGCPDSYNLRMLMNDHPGDHMHQHVGVDTDMNGDGYICEKHVGVRNHIHVHIDNDFPLN